MLQAAQAGRTSRLLFEQATTLERVARQQLILEDTALLDDYARVRQEFHQTTQQLAHAAARTPERSVALDELAEREEPPAQAARRAAAHGPTRSASWPTATRRSSTTRRRMLAASNQLTQRAIERLQETATAGPREVAVRRARHRRHRARARDPVRGADRAPDPPARPRDPADGHAPTSRMRSSVTGPQDLRYLGQRLEWLRTRLSELEEQQTRFLRHVSHELKTPLTAVREGAELLRDNVGGKLVARAARDRAHRAREHAVAAEADRGPAHLSPDARDGARNARARSRWPTSCAAWCASRSSPRWRG